MSDRFPNWPLIALTSALALAPTPVAADAFDDAVKAADSAFAEQDRQYAAEVQAQDAAWQRYSDAIDRAWKRYSAEIDAAWGDAAKKPSKKEFVDYSKDRDARTSVDFKAGKLQVDVILKPGESPDSEQVKARIKQRLEQVVAEPAHEDAELHVAPPAGAEVSEKPVYPLQGQLKLDDGRPVDRNNAAIFAAQTVAEKPITKHVIHTPQGQKQVVTLEVQLVPGHLQRRIRPYLPRVREMSHRFGLPVSLILGIMQTESYFNPMARSGVPAFGLMQLVPRSGARDAYRYVYQDDRVVSSEYLYDPDRNIELGSAYLKLLQVREMKRIRDPKSRMVCAIAAYNTGGGNVAKAFIPGSHNIRKASALINQMSYDEVYDHLRHRLPYEETQLYVQKVTKYMHNYEALDEE